VVVKLVKKTHFNRIHEIDLDSGRRLDMDKAVPVDDLNVEGAIAADRPSTWKKAMRNF
jgi:hypothetical protein